jgi:hypothetical protein
LQAGFDAQAELITESRSPYSPLPFLSPEHQKITPSPEAFARLVRGNCRCLQIIAPGGAGKTRLMLELGRWLFQDQVAEHPTCALLIDDEFDDLLDLVQRKVTAALGTEHAVPPNFIKSLLRSGRLWVLVDRMSERKSSTQRAFGALYEKASPKALVCSSRFVIPIGPVKPCIVRPLPLDRATLLGFLGDQLRAEGAEALYPTLSAQGALVQKLARLITIEGRELPVTPLLVRVFVSQAVEVGRRGGPVEELASNVPDAYFNYVERLDSTQASADSADMEAGARARGAAALAAFVELGSDFRPKHVPRDTMRQAFENQSRWDKASVDPLTRMVSSGLLVTRQVGAEVLIKFALDPLAECLAAHEHARHCGPDLARWLELLARVKQQGEHGQAFLFALHLNHAAYGAAQGYPPLSFGEEGPLSSP